MPIVKARPQYISDRNESFDITEMQSSHLLNVITHHMTQLNTLEALVAKDNTLFAKRNASLRATISALTAELAIRDPDEDVLEEF